MGGPLASISGRGMRKYHGTPSPIRFCVERNWANMPIRTEPVMSTKRVQKWSWACGQGEFVRRWTYVNCDLLLRAIVNGGGVSATHSYGGVVSDYCVKK